VATMSQNDDFRSDDAAFPYGPGDAGRTAFGLDGDVAKIDVRVAAWQDCDEANASVSVAMAVGNLPIGVTSTLASVQNDLFDVVADLSAPFDTSGHGSEHDVGDKPDDAAARIAESHITRLERAIEHYAQEAPDLSGLVLPGGTVAAALLYQARAVVRRAERTVWAAVDAHPESVNPLCARYLNRLSRLLFVLARGANAEHGDERWVPEASARAMAEEEDDAGYGAPT
jgi:cob(I)alamin adenosyltransferase